MNTFVRLVDYDNDFEAQLDFYAEARAAFSSLDAVLENLIQVSVPLITLVTICKTILIPSTFYGSK